MGRRLASGAGERHSDYTYNTNPRHAQDAYFAAKSAAKASVLTAEVLAEFYTQHNEPAKAQKAKKLLQQYTTAEVVESCLKKHGASPLKEPAGFEEQVTGENVAMLTGTFNTNSMKASLEDAGSTVDMGYAVRAFRATSHMHGQNPVAFHNLCLVLASPENPGAGTARNTNEAKEVCLRALRDR